MTNKSISFLCSSQSFGGLEMNMVKMAGWLMERGHRILFFSMPNAPITNYAEKLHIPTEAIKRHRKYYDLAAAFRLKKKLQSQQIKILVIRDTRDMSLAVTTKFLMGGALCIIYIQAMQLGVKKKSFFHTYRFNQLDYWIATSRYLGNQLKSHTNLNPKKIRVIPLGLDVSRFSENPMSRKEARSFFNINSDGFLAGIIGRLDPLKGQHLVISAVKKLNASGKEAALLMVGDTTMHEGSDYKNSLLEKAEAISGKVFFRDFTDKPELFFRACDVFIMASAKETFGMVTVESLASGTPVIGSDAGGTSEILGEGAYGFLFKSGDADELTSCLEKLYTDTALREKWSVQGQEIARKKYSHSVFCERLEELMKEWD